MIRRVSLLHMRYARTVVDELGEEKGTELSKKVIWACDVEIGERARERIEAIGLEPTIENFAKGRVSRPSISTTQMCSDLHTTLS